MRWILILSLFFFAPNVWAETEPEKPLDHVHINIHDKASLQRGVKLFMNYCSGCHSLQYLRYNRMAQDIGITDSSGDILKQLVETNLIFTGASILSPILPSMKKEDAQEWFGVAPPDLSLVTRVRGVDWVYAYLRSFYSDPNRPFGVNNLIYPDVAMPNVLVNLQGVLKPIYRMKIIKTAEGAYKIKEVDHLVLVQPGAMSQAQFDSAVNDIINFLEYVAEPMKIKRQQLGIWVLLFVIIFAVFAYLLKREYWKDIK